MRLLLLWPAFARQACVCGADCNRVWFATAEGVLYAEKDFNLQEHPEIPGVSNLQVIKLMQSFTSKELVTERFAWRHYYWYALMSPTQLTRLLQPCLLLNTAPHINCSSFALCMAMRKSSTWGSSAPVAQLSGMAMDF